MRIFINSRTQSTHARAAAFKSLATAPKSLKGQKQSQATNSNQTTKAMTILDLTYDETRNPSRRDPRNFISSPRGDELYKATANILPWEAATWDTGDRVVVPSVFLEKIVRLAPVPDPDGLSSLSFITRTLDCDGWLRAAITVLIDEGLIHDQDEDERWNLVIFEHPQDLQQRADRLVAELVDVPEMEVTPSAFEWLEGFDDRPEDREIAWLAGITMADLTKTTKNLQSYTDLALMLGPRSTAASRIQPGGTFHSMVGQGGTGGQLCTAMTTFYYPAGQALGSISPAFLAPRLADFLVESKWPFPYEQAFSKWVDYSFDLPRQAAWKTATRQQWAAMIQGRLPYAVSTNLPMQNEVFKDYLTDPAKLVRAMQTLGDSILSGDEGQKLPFYKVMEIEAHLERFYQATITSEREEGGDTDAILEKLQDRIMAAKGSAKVPAADRDDDDIRGPKPGQMTRALAEKSYSSLEAKHIDKLRAGNTTNDDRLVMFADNFAAESVIPKAVLLAAKGVRLSVYTGHGGSDYLAILHGERHLLSMYLGQSIAYDHDLGSVPKDLKTFVYDPAETQLTRDFEWGKLDPLNKCLLKLRGEEAGTEFHQYKTTNVYHDGDMIRNVSELYGKKFDALGFQRDVPEGKGLSFRQFMSRILRIQKFAVALDTEEQRGAYALIDDYVYRAYEAAAASAKRTIYSASPADKQLSSWLGPEEMVVIELEATLKAIGEHATHRRNMGSIFGKKTKAAHLSGFAVAGGHDPTPGAPGKTKDKPSDKKKGGKDK